LSISPKLTICVLCQNECKYSNTFLACKFNIV